MFIFMGSLDDHNHESIFKIVRFDFESKRWTDIPKMGEKLQAIQLTCAMTTSFDKKSTSNVMIVFNGNTKSITTIKDIYLVSSAILTKIKRSRNFAEDFL